MNTNKPNREQHNKVKLAANFQWVAILQALAGLDDKQVSVKAGKAGTLCPLCGGNDRYSFKDEERGGWACRKCGGGDGWTLLQSVNGWDYTTAEEQVGRYLGIVNRATSVDLEALRKEQQAKARQRVQDEQNKLVINTSKERKVWEQAGTVANHPWIAHKQLSPEALSVCRQSGSKLLIPVFSPAGERISHQWVAQISPDNYQKNFHYGIPTAGGLVELGAKEAITVLVGESFADTDAALQLVGNPCVAICAFSAGQIPAAVEYASQKHPFSEIVICADNDKEGWKSAVDAAVLVPGVSVSYPPSGKDWSEYLLSGGKESPLANYQVIEAPAGEGVNAMDSNVVEFPQPEQVYQWPNVLPLNDELPPVLPITTDMVPAELREWLIDICERMDGAPFEYAALSAVVAMGSLIGRKVGIHPKALDSWRVIPNVWGAMIGRPSIKKTPVASEVMKPINALEREARENFKKDLKTFEAEMKIEEILNKEAENKAKALVKKGDIDGARLLLADTAETTPDKPTPRRYIVNDATVEKLGVILEDNPQGLLLFRDELSGWLLGMNREDRQQERAFYLEAWNGDGTFSYDRIGRNDVFMKSTTTAVLGGIQPGRLLPILSGQANGSGDDGLVERLQLAVFPDKPPFKYVDRSPNLAAANRATDVFRRLDSIPFDVDGDIPVLRFAPDAQERFSQWYVQVNECLSSDGISPVIESHLGKFPSLIPALALIFHIVDNGHELPVSLEALEMAIRWGDVLKTHAGRVYGLAGDHLAGARILAERLDKLPSPFKKRQIRDKGWLMLTDIRDIDRAISILLERGYLLEVSIPPASGKGRPSVDYWINPTVIEE